MSEQLAAVAGVAANITAATADAANSGATRFLLRCRVIDRVCCKEESCFDFLLVLRQAVTTRAHLRAGVLIGAGWSGRTLGGNGACASPRIAGRPKAHVGSTRISVKVCLARMHAEGHDRRNSDARIGGAEDSLVLVAGARRAQVVRRLSPGHRAGRFHSKVSEIQLLVASQARATREPRALGLGDVRRMDPAPSRALF